MEKFYTILTNLGCNKINSGNMKIATFAVGDGGGAYYNPSENQRELKNEKYRNKINSIKIDKNNNNWTIVEMIIPMQIGGFDIREIGLFDDEGDLIAISKCPETSKPLTSQNVAKDLILQMVLEISNESNFILQIDNNMSNIATKKEIEDLKMIIEDLLIKVEKLELGFGTRYELAREVKLDKTIFNIKENEQIQLTATVLPLTANQAVVWTSSDPAIASIDEMGIVTPLKPGNVAFTAKTIKGDKTKSCLIEIESILDSDSLIPEISKWNCSSSITTTNIEQTTKDMSMNILFTVASKNSCFYLKPEIISKYVGQYINIGYKMIKTLEDKKGFGLRVTKIIKNTLEEKVIIDEDIVSNTDYKKDVYISEDILEIKVELRSTSSSQVPFTTEVRGLYVKISQSKIIAYKNDEKFGDREATSYNYTNIKLKENVIKGLVNEDCICWLQTSDIHTNIYDEKQKDSCLSQLEASVMASKILPLNAIIFLGDNIGDMLSKEKYKDVPNMHTSILLNAKCSVYFGKGNHDANIWSGSDLSNLITNQEFFELYTDKSIDKNNDTIMFDLNQHRNKGYFYIDKPSLRHRYIILNTSEIYENLDSSSDLEKRVGDGVRTKHQFNWLKNIAMNMIGKTDWTVSIHCHYVMHSGEWNHYYNPNREYMQNLFSSFKKGTKGKMVASGQIPDNEWDFTQQGAIKLLGIFGGHIHDDCYTVVDGVNYITTNSAWSNRRMIWNSDPSPKKYPPSREYTGLSALSQNVFIYNKKENRMYVIKLGAGDDNIIDL